MNTIGNAHRDEDGSRSDRRLVEELESLYHEVARLDQAYPTQEGIEGGRPVQSVQEQQPAGAASEPDTAVETAIWCDDHHPPCREALLERLDKVRDAYEKMLACWPYASGDSPMAGV